MRQNLQRRVYNLSVQDPNLKKKRSHGIGYKTRRAEKRNIEILRRRNNPAEFLPKAKKTSDLDFYEDMDHMIWINCCDCSHPMDYDDRRLCIDCPVAAGALTMTVGKHPEIPDMEKANRLVVCNSCTQNDKHKDHQNISYEWFKAQQNMNSMVHVAMRTEGGCNQ